MEGGGRLGTVRKERKQIRDGRVEDLLTVWQATDKRWEWETMSRRIVTAEKMDGDTGFRKVMDVKHGTDVEEENDELEKIIEKNNELETTEEVCKEKVKKKNKCIFM